MMLIKAKHDNFKGITAGKVYEGTECSDGYTYTNDQGKHDYAHKSHFEVVDEPLTRIVIRADQFSIGPTAAFRTVVENGIATTVHNEPKEKTVKIKAKEDGGCNHYKKGDVFDATLKGDEVYFTDKYGCLRYRHVEEFTLLHDEPAIEVGSVWRDDQGNDHTVKFSSENTVVYGDGDWCADPDDFLRLCKPKPKTVTMYFYDLGGEYSACSTPDPYGKPSFTREIELP